MARMIHRNVLPSRRLPTGFSLIEVMVSVVVLATGLLALAALQGALARNSADAKARGAVMAALTSRMNEIRQAPPAAGKTWTMADTNPNADWVDVAATQAGASNLTVVESETTYYWKDKATGYVTTAVTKPASTFVRATLAATWAGADGTKSLSLSSDISGNIYGDGRGYPVPDPDGSASKRPIVRQSNPGNEAGVIPIAVSDDPNAASTAASNPKPLLIGQTKVVGTQFEVLSYIPEGTTSAVLTRRINTNVVKCRCSLGQSSPDTGVAGKAQWPTVWNGDKYETYPGSGDAAGVSKRAGEDPAYASSSGRRQSPLCTECCRDHHDNGSGEQYNPEGTANLYNLASGALTGPVTTGQYIVACRVIKSDGLWKTASDMYVRQYGLLATTPDSTATSISDPLQAALQAKDGAPYGGASTEYQGFIKNYLGGYLTSLATTGNAPTSAAVAKTNYEAYNSGYLENPKLITIPSASSTDERYLHARGLLVDHLSDKARTKLAKVVADCTKTNKLECLLPQLPFTTINMTELAKWSEEGGALDVVDSGTLLASNVSQPFGGRTRGMAPTGIGGAKVSSKTWSSNSGIAFSHDIPGSVNLNTDPKAELILSDTQDFSVLGGRQDGLKVAVTGYQEPLGTLTVNLTAPSSSFCNLAADGGFRCPVTGMPAVVRMNVGNFNKNVTIADAEADRVPASCVVNNVATSFMAAMPYKVSYASVWAGVNSATPTEASIAGGVATWTSPSSPLVSVTDVVNVELRGRTKQCPATYRCSNNSANVSWPTASTFTADACLADPVAN